MDPRPLSNCVLCEEEKVSLQLCEGFCSSCCPECKRIDKAMVAIAHNDQLLDKGMKTLWKHLEQFHGLTCVKTHRGNGAPQGAFAFTLTMSPADKLSEGEMIDAVNKLLAQKSCPLKKYVWYIEYGDVVQRTHPHIHGMYETVKGGRIEAKHFKRAWPIWNEAVPMGAGFRGGYHRPVRDNEAYVDYVKKCADVRHGEFNLLL